MSYGIYLKCPVSEEPLRADSVHHIRYAMGGTHGLWLSVRNNYAPHFIRTMGKDGIRTLYGKSGAESIPLLEQAIAQLGDDVDEDYWKPTEGNAKRALHGLLSFARMRPDGVWDGD